jgi:hypothetical protein
MPEAMLYSIAAVPFEADPWLTGFTVFGVVIVLGLIAWVVRPSSNRLFTLKQLIVS